MWRGVDKGFADRPVGFTEKDTTFKQGTPTSSDYSDEPPRKKVFRASKPIEFRGYHDDSITSSAYGGTPDTDSEQPQLISTSSSDSCSEDEDKNTLDSPINLEERSSTISTNWSFPKPTKSPTSIPVAPTSTTRISSAKPRKHSTANNSMANEMLLDMVKKGFTIPAIRDEWKNRTGYDTSESSWRSRFWRLNAKGLTGGIQVYGSVGRELRTTEDSTGEFDSARGIRFCAVNSRCTPGTSPYFRQSTSTPYAPSSKPSIQGNTRQTTELSTRETIEVPDLASAGPGDQSSSTIYSHLMTPATSSIGATSAEIASSPFTLAAHKLARTTLRIVDANAYTPLKLRSCPNISAFFAKVLDVCGLTAHQDALKALKLTFDWMEPTDAGRHMLLIERYEDSFESMMEMIDEAPCWAEGGKCTVGVELVLKDGGTEMPARRFSKGESSSRKASTASGILERKFSTQFGEASSRKTSTASEMLERKLSTLSGEPSSRKASLASGMPERKVLSQSGDANSRKTSTASEMLERKLSMQSGEPSSRKTSTSECETDEVAYVTLEEMEN